MLSTFEEYLPVKTCLVTCFYFQIILKSRLHPSSDIAYSCISSFELVRNSSTLFRLRISVNAISFTSRRIKTARLPRLETMVYHDLCHQISRILLTSSKLLWQAPVHYKE